MSRPGRTTDAAEGLPLITGKTRLNHESHESGKWAYHRTHGVHRKETADFNH